MDHMNVNSVGIQISADGQRVWVCIDGECRLRVKGIGFVELRDDRPESSKEDRED